MFITHTARPAIEEIINTLINYTIVKMNLIHFVRKLIKRFVRKLNMCSKLTYLMYDRKMS